MKPTVRRHPPTAPTAPQGPYLLELPLRAPRVVLAVAAALTLMLAPRAPSVRVDSSIDTLLVAGDPERAYHEEMERVFGSDEVTRIGVFAGDVFAPATLARIDRLSRAIAAIEGVRDVVSLTTVTGVEATDAGLRAGRLMRRLPRDGDEAAAFRDKVLGNPLYLGSVVSPDGLSSALTVLYEPMSDGEFAARGLEERIRVAAVTALDGAEEFAIAGIPTLKMHGARRMEKDVHTFSVLALGLVVVVLGIMFGRVRGVVLPLLVVVMGVAWTDGLMALLGQPITIGTLVLNPLLMAVGVAYAIHVMSRYFQEATAGASSEEIVRRALRHVALPVWLAALTTLFGFATLVPHPVPTIRDLGLYSIVGISVIFAASLTMIPAILVLLPPPRVRVANGRRGELLIELLSAIARFDIRHPRFVILVTGALSAASLFGVAKLRVETDYLGFFHPASTVRRDSERIASRLAGTHPLYVVVEGDGPRSLTRVEALEGMRRLQDFLARQPRVDKAVSALDYLTLARRALAPDAEGDLPRSQEEADQILLLVNPADVRSLWSRDASRANVLLYTTLSASAEVESFVERVERFARERLPRDLRVHVTGTVVLLNRTADTIARQQVWGLAQMIALLSVVMVGLFRSLRMGLLSLVPNVVPILLLFGLMGASGVSLNVSTSMIAAIAIGIAVDDTIHYLTEFGAELRKSGDREQAVHDAMRSVGQPILFTTVSLAAGFLVSCLSGFQPVRHFGALSAATMGIGLATDLLITPVIAFTWTGFAARARGETGPFDEDSTPLPRRGGSYG